MNNIFELIMKEARSRPGYNVKLNAYHVINDLYKRIFHTVSFNPDGSLKPPSKDDKPA